MCYLSSNYHHDSECFIFYLIIKLRYHFLKYYDSPSMTSECLFISAVSHQNAYAVADPETWERGVKKHEIKASTTSCHLFYDYLLQASPPPSPDPLLRRIVHRYLNYSDL